MCSANCSRFPDTSQVFIVCPFSPGMVSSELKIKGLMTSGVRWEILYIALFTYVYATIQKRFLSTYTLQVYLRLTSMPLMIAFSDGGATCYAFTCPLHAFYVKLGAKLHRISFVQSCTACECNVSFRYDRVQVTLAYRSRSVLSSEISIFSVHLPLAGTIG